MKKYLIFSILFIALALPFAAIAQTPFEEQEIDYIEPGNPAGLSGIAVNQTISCSDNVNDIGDVLCKIGIFLNSLIPILLALGVVYFVWGVVQYVIGSDEDAKTRGKDRIVFGIIGFAIIISLWGLVAIVIKTFGIEGSAPQVNLLNFQVDTAQQSSGALCDLGGSPKLQNLLGYATCIIKNYVISLIFAIAIVAFLWGVVKFVILGAGEEKSREEGRQFMLWGIIALAIMISVWGLVSVLTKTFNVDNVIPQVKGR